MEYKSLTIEQLESPLTPLRGLYVVVTVVLDSNGQLKFTPSGWNDANDGPIVLQILPFFLTLFCHILLRILMAIIEMQ